jgi:DNA-binding transcriptional LysR family regulator
MIALFEFDKRYFPELQFEKVEVNCGPGHWPSMDITLARTFQAIVEAGNFKDAAVRLCVTQSTVSTRIRTLEDVLGRSLFERSKAGAKLTPAGEQFQRHATALLRVWRHAQLDVALSDHHTDHLAVGAQLSLWEGFLLKWVAWLRDTHSHIAVTTSVGASNVLIERLSEGTLDLAIVYRAQTRAGIVIEHILDEELVLVSSGDGSARKPGRGYVFVNWGPEFEADHADTYPELASSGLHLDLGAIGVNYLFDAKAAGYFPLRIAAPYLADGRLKIVERARRFVYPVYLAYPEDRDEGSYEPLLDGLRRLVDKTPALHKPTD